jgi:hypothetical protein
VQKLIWQYILPPCTRLFSASRGRVAACCILIMGGNLAATEAARAQQSPTNHRSAEKLSEPVRPTWQQLMNGSLDTQEIEIRGLIESLTSRKDGWVIMNLRTKDGVLNFHWQKKRWKK